VDKFVGKKLQGDVATELQVFSFVDHTHAPTADFAQDAVMGNRLPHGFGRSGHYLDMLGGVLSKGQLQELSQLRCKVKRAAVTEKSFRLRDHRIHD
jgi:hypothetical protein